MGTLQKEEYSVVQLSPRDELIQEINRIKKEKDEEKNANKLLKKEVAKLTELSEKRSEILKMENRYLESFENLALSYFGLDFSHLQEMKLEKAKELQKLIIRKSGAVSFLQKSILIAADTGVALTCLLWLGALIRMAYWIIFEASSPDLIDHIVAGGALWIIGALFTTAVGLLIVHCEILFSKWARKKFESLAFRQLAKILAKIHGEESIFPCGHVLKNLGHINNINGECELMLQKSENQKLPLSKIGMFSLKFLEGSLFKGLDKIK